MIDGIQLRLEDVEEGAEYCAFVDKFKPKKTTDDCYTPENIYQAVADWVTATYGDAQPFVRPFWPGGDYERADYPEGCAVVDNPPFSILAQITRYYMRRGIRFFLFAPTLTLFSGTGRDGMCYVPVGVQITYANGADVNTSFITNMDTAQVVSAPGLYQTIKAANDANKKAETKELPKYSYPDNVLTAAAAYQFSRYGIDYRLEREDCVFIRGLDAQKAAGKGIFGGAYLLSERAAAERAAAERAAAERAAAERAAAERAAAERAAAARWALSDREREIVRRLGK